MDTVVKKVNDFFETKYSIIILSAIGTIFAVLELVLFFTGEMEINGVTFTDDLSGAKLWVTLFAVFLSLATLYFGFFIGIANTTGSKYASQLGLIGMSMTIILDVLAGLWLVVLELGIAIPMLFFRRNFWNNEKYKEEKYSLKKMWPWIVVVGISSAAFFYGIVLLWGEQIYNTSILPFMPPSNSDRSYVWYMDASVATLGIMGNFCIIFRWRSAYIWWTAAKLPLIIAFFANGNLIQIFQQLMWLCIDMGTVLAFTHQQREHKRTKEQAIE